MNYQIKLNNQELKALAWLSDRGYFPGAIYDKMSQADIQSDPNYTIWDIPEHIAWELTNLRENDPDAYLTCCGGRLLEEIINLENSIV